MTRLILGLWVPTTASHTGLGVTHPVRTGVILLSRQLQQAADKAPDLTQSLEFRGCITKGLGFMIPSYISGEAQPTKVFVSCLKKGLFHH